MSEISTGKFSKTDWVELDLMTDEMIDYSDIPPLGGSFFDKAQLRIAEGRNRGDTQSLSAIISEFDRLIAEMSELRAKVLKLVTSDKQT